MPAGAPAQYALTASISGSSMKVIWMAPAGSAKGDHIQLSSPGAPNWWSLWNSTTQGATSGSFTVPMPSGPGLYEFRYYKSNGGAAAVVSNAIVLNCSAFTVKATPDTVSAGGTITVSWTAPPGRPGNWGDTIGLYKVGQASDVPAVTYMYPQGSAGGTTSGTYTIAAPAAGNYEFRYILGDEGYVTSVVTPVTVR
jgi:hypothetical protein